MRLLLARHPPTATLYVRPVEDVGQDTTLLWAALVLHAARVPSRRPMPLVDAVGPRTPYAPTGPSVITPTGYHTIYFLEPLGIPAFALLAKIALLLVYTIRRRVAGALVFTAPRDMAMQCVGIALNVLLELTR